MFVLSHILHVLNLDAFRAWLIGGHVDSVLLLRHNKLNFPTPVKLG